MTDYRIGHLEGLQSPWGNAGGVVKTVEDAEKMARTGVGWIEAGSYTLEPRAGNSPNGETVYYHNPQTGETTNSLGMPNKGMDSVEGEIWDMVEEVSLLGKKLIVNVAPVSSDPVTEARELVVRAFEGGADAVLVNAGCPNVITEDGGRHEILSYDANALRMVLSGLKDTTEKYDPVFVRLSPYSSRSQMREALRAIQASEAVSAVFLPNTWPGHRPIDESGENILEVPGGTGGLSGPAKQGEATIQTFWAVNLLWDSKIDVVSSSSIMTGQEMARRMRIGAVAGAGTTFYYESENGWQYDTDKLLDEFANKYEKAGQA